MGTLLQNFRQANNLSAKYVADFLGISEELYRKMENGDLLVSTVDLDRLSGLYRTNLKDELKNQFSDLKLQAVNESEIVDTDYALGHRVTGDIWVVPRRSGEALTKKELETLSLISQSPFLLAKKNTEPAQTYPLETYTKGRYLDREPLFWHVASGSNAAGAFLAMDKLEKKFHGDFYMIPASVYGVICAGKKDIQKAGFRFDMEWMTNLLNRMNQTIAKDQRLSSHVYEYYQGTKTMIPIGVEPTTERVEQEFEEIFER